MSNCDMFTKYVTYKKSHLVSLELFHLHDLDKCKLLSLYGILISSYGYETLKQSAL